MTVANDDLPEYAELHCISNFSFLRGASHPEELIAQAAQSGYCAIAITDECSLAGIVRAHKAAKKTGIKLIVGSEFKLENTMRFILLARNRSGYATLSALISLARRTAKKSQYSLNEDQLASYLTDDCYLIWLPSKKIDNIALQHASWLKQKKPNNLFIALELFLDSHDRSRLAVLQNLSQRYNIPLCATSDVHMHHPSRRNLLDVLTAIRLSISISQLGLLASRNAQKHLRSRVQLASLYPSSTLAASSSIARDCSFCLNELRYEYPEEITPEQYTPESWLRYLTEQGIKKRWPQGETAKVRRQVEHELELILELDYAAYFLTVYDIVRFARQQGILCQGRGSAANSVICYCLGITEIDPVRMNLLFERFISKQRQETPDIDVDFEHERREEVIQYIYNKYGRDRAALAATVISYRPRSAIRDVAKAFSFSADCTEQLTRCWRYNNDKFSFDTAELADIQLDLGKLQQFTLIVQQLIGFPRHLSQHVGGFVIARTKLTDLVPVENAAMPERTVIQWDKDDLEYLGLLKIDVLALGILTAIRKSIELVNSYQQKQLSLQDIPAEDEKVYAMLQKADAIGVFQIESRAQMSMLPRLKPKSYYDLVIQIAIVRPGPIQGEMVHPYLARRQGREAIVYPSLAVKKVLERTLGVPIFQEQVMQLAMVVAGFSPGEADQLRRSMAAWKKRGGLEKFENKLLQGMAERGYESKFAQQLFRQIQGFGEYGFPESHSASFALLAYASAWLKYYHPSAFCCALLNSQPMGFYAPSQLIRDAQAHHVKVLAVDVCYSDYDSVLEDQQHFLHQVKHGNIQTPPLRLGLRLIKGLSYKAAKRIVVARRAHAFKNMHDMVLRTQLQQKDIDCLAAADALKSLVGHRHKAYWQGAGLDLQNDLLRDVSVTEAEALLPVPTTVDNVSLDYAHLGLSLRSHPLALLRSELNKKAIVCADAINHLANKCRVKAAGLVISRQSPRTASGVTFLTLEDETGFMNVIIWPKLAEKKRHILINASLMAVKGQVQTDGDMLYLIAENIADISYMFADLKTKTRDFR